jgi:hypothetical protein
MKTEDILATCKHLLNCFSTSSFTCYALDFKLYLQIRFAYVNLFIIPNQKIPKQYAQQKTASTKSS